MRIRSLIKNNKFFSIISVAFLIWLAFLITLSFIGHRNVIFYDALGQVDVSSDFSSQLPMIRYIIEPLVAITFVFGKEFTWMFLFLIFYPILRSIYLFLKKRKRFSSEKYKLISHILSDIISFSFKVLVLAVLIIGIFILIGFAIQGFFFVNRYFMVPIQLGIHIGIIIILVKIGYMMLRLFHPKLRLDLSKKFHNQKKIKTKKRQFMKREIIYYIGIGAMMISSNIVLISTPLPPHKIIPTIELEDDEFLFDFHIHTTMSDGWLTPEERVVWYMDNGIDGAVFTDHDNIRGALIARDFVERNNFDFIVLIGQEWTDHANDIHMNYFGLEEVIVPLESYTLGGPKAMNASELINYVKANGGYITVNHYNFDINPNGGNGVPYSLTQLTNWGIDGFEIVNGDSYGGKYIQIRQYCLSNNLTCIGGSDIESNKDLDAFVKLKLVDPTNLTISNIFETLKNNTHEIIAIDLNPKVVDFPGDLDDFGFYILEEFINYILNLDVYQALSWIVWSIIGYSFLFLIYRKIKNVDLKFLKGKIKII